DLKTGTRGPGTFQSQVGGYSMLARSHKIEIAEARIDYLKRVGIRSVPAAPVTRAIPIASAETAASNIIRRIADSLRIFRAGDPERRILPGDPWAFSANPNSMLCSPKYCSAFGTEFCREGSVDRQVTTGEE